MWSSNGSALPVYDMQVVYLAPEVKQVAMGTLDVFRSTVGALPTNVPGVEICEHFPLQAKMWDKLACVRSIVSVDEHSDSLVMTGFSENNNRTQHRPSIGAEPRIMYAWMSE